MKSQRIIIGIAAGVCLLFGQPVCGAEETLVGLETAAGETGEMAEAPAEETMADSPEETAEDFTESAVAETMVDVRAETGGDTSVGEMEIIWNPEWEYAGNSMIHTDSVTLYRASSPSGSTVPTEGQGGDQPRRFVVAVNAGHGTAGGSEVRTLCHPDGTPKVTGGSTAAGETTATAISTGTQLLDGTSEADANLSLAMILKELLLEHGYDVLMIRENENTQLDNIARTVFANQNADCHLALHYDSTDFDKGAYYMSVPDVASYRTMEPVASCWQLHEQLGQCILQGMQSKGIRLFENGSMPMDLTQTSYSTIPSIDIEVGDRGSDHSYETQALIAEGIAAGIDIYVSTPGAGDAE